MNRLPAVQGTFYPDDEKKLKRLLKNYFCKEKISKKYNAVIAPHAGYTYSGKIAAKTIFNLQEKKNFAILCPNHTGYGAKVSVFPEGEWENVLGKVKVNQKICKKIVSKIEEAELEEEAHLQEHAIEVQLPFLQYLFKEFEIVPICIATDCFETLKEIGEVLSEEKELALIASSDFSHYVPLENAKKNDLQAIKKILELDSDGFLKLVKEKNFSICGYAPITVLIEYCKKKKLKGKMIAYDTSASASGDKNSVVGYAGLGFK